MFDHFALTLQLPIKDYKLSSYACYLIVQIGDPRKEVIAPGQTYFAIQTYSTAIKKCRWDNTGGFANT